MIKKILSFLGYIPREELDISNKLLKVSRDLMENKDSEILKLRSEIIVLTSNQKKEEVEVKKEIISYNIADPTPSDDGERKAYVSQVSTFFRNILEKKLDQMIGTSLHLLSETDNDRELDIQIKGVIYSFKELKAWGQAMHNEEIAYAIPKGDELEEKTLLEKLDDIKNG
jgi:hypothetical protein